MQLSDSMAKLNLSNGDQNEEGNDYSSEQNEEVLETDEEDD